jgi:hypothetical protein
MIKTARLRIVWTIVSMLGGIFLSASAVAQPPATLALRVLPEGQLPQDKRLGPLLDLNGYFPFSPPSSREAWQRRAAQLRRQVLVAAGLWPMPNKSPLHAVIHGKVDRGQYTVEKVFFESWPGHYVTGNLYRPKCREGKLPAVLSPLGHWPQGRFTDVDRKEARQLIVDGAERFESGARSPMQARCVQLARMGCVVFHYDMVGYADSRQLQHNAGTRPETSDPKAWGFYSPQAEARLQSIFGLQTYNSIRALDFLCSLPDVDPARIGVTGESGGGTQTFILCAIDPRPVVAMPVVMVSTAMQGGCACENGLYLRIGTGNIELAGLFAPKPLGLIAADDWTNEIATKGLPELKKLYRLFAADDMVMAKPLLQFPHNYNFVSRGVMYKWFNKHLKLKLEEPIVEEDFQLLSEAEMSVWDAQHPVPPTGTEYERTLLRQMTDDARRQMERLVPNDAASLNEYRRIVGGAVETMIGRGLPAPGELQAAKSQSQDFAGGRMTKFLLRYPAHGEELPAVRLDPKNWNHRTVIWLDRSGKQSLFTASGSPRPGVLRLLDKGFAILIADLFEQGEFTADGRPLAKCRMNRNNDANWGRYAGFTFGYNRPLFAQRVHDVLSLVAFAHNGNDATERVDLIALRGAGCWAAAARAIAGGAIDRAAIDTGGFRFAALAAIDDPNFLPGGAKYGDLPGTIALSAPHHLWLAGEGDNLPPLISAAYRAAGHRENVTAWREKGKDPESAAIEWLSRESRDGI